MFDLADKTSELLLNGHQTYTDVVEKSVWGLIDITVIDLLSYNYTSNPDSEINSQKLFHLKLAKMLVQPLLDLKSIPECPQHLQNVRGRRPVMSENRLRKWQAPCLQGSNVRDVL